MPWKRETFGSGLGEDAQLSIRDSPTSMSTESPDLRLQLMDSRDKGRWSLGQGLGTALRLSRYYIIHAPVCIRDICTRTGCTRLYLDDGAYGVTLHRHWKFGCGLALPIVPPRPKKTYGPVENGTAT